MADADAAATPGERDRDTQGETQRHTPRHTVREGTKAAKDAERQFVAKEVAGEAEELREARHGHAQAKRKLGDAKRAFQSARQELYVQLHIPLLGAHTPATATSLTDPTVRADAGAGNEHSVTSKSKKGGCSCNRRGLPRPRSKPRPSSHRNTSDSSESSQRAARTRTVSARHERTPSAKPAKPATQRGRSEYRLSRRLAKRRSSPPPR